MQTPSHYLDSDGILDAALINTDYKTALYELEQKASIKLVKKESY